MVPKVDHPAATAQPWSAEVSSFSVETARSVSSVVVYVTGELDAATAPTLRQVLQDLIDEQETPALVVEVSRMTVLDSSGLRVLVEAALRAARRGGKLALEGVSSSISRVLEISGANRFFDVPRPTLS